MKVWTASVLQLATFSLALSGEILLTRLFIQPAQASSTVTPHQTEPLTSEKLSQSPTLEAVQTGSNTSESQLPKTQWNAFTPPARGVPGRREGGGTRGPCPPGLSDFTALIPASTMGRTVSPQPTFFFYLPIPLEDTLVELELTDEGDQSIYKTAFKLTNEKPGILKVSVADQKNPPTLEVNKNYHWYLAIKCDVNEPSSDLVVHGWINRVPLTSPQTQILEEADPIARLDFFAKQVLWYETLSTLAELRLSNPDDEALQTQWTELLNAVGLDQVAQYFLIDTQQVPYRETPESETLFP